jgi:dihydroorotase
MILKNAQIYHNGVLKLGSLQIHDGKFQKIIFHNENEEPTFSNIEKNETIIKCDNKILLPGIIDVHSHLRDLDQSEKETFSTATQAAAASGITTVFDMPNTKPPAISSENVKKWINKAKNDIYIDVGFISGVPNNLNREEFKKIVDLGVVGFKIYPHSPIAEIDWLNSENFKKLLSLANEFQVPLFIHPQMPLDNRELKKKFEKDFEQKRAPLKIYDEIYSNESEKEFINYVQKHYEKFILENSDLSEYPHVHFCHISTKEALYLLYNAKYEISMLNFTYEVTPHHLLLENDMKFEKDTYGKVLPPLRDKIDRDYLITNLKKGNIEIIATDHAPHTIEEKSKSFMDAPSGFPGFETYTILLLDKVFKNEISLEVFIKSSSENPAKIFNLTSKGFIREGFDADFFLIYKTNPYKINPTLFKSKAKFSPFKGFETSIRISETYLRGVKIFDEKQELKEKFGRIIVK